MADVLQLVFAPTNLLLIVLGTVLGLVFGVLPGLGAIQALAILLPLTFALPTDQALAMLGAVFVSSIYAGSITSVLLNTPGDPTSAMTVLDGYPLAQQGKAGQAIGAATAASFVGGILGVALLIAAAAPVGAIAIRLGAPEFFLLLLIGLLTIGVMIRSDPLKGLLSAAIGVMLSQVGFSPTLGVPRYTFGTLILQDGISFAVLTVGLFAISEAFLLIASPAGISSGRQVAGGLVEGMRLARSHGGTLVRASGIGMFVGVIPAIGAVTANILSYGAEVRRSRHPERFGKGEIAGVIASEASNNATVGASLIPTLTLGIPGSAGSALLIGALTLHGIRPGPRLMAEDSVLVYAFFGSLIIAQFMFAGIGLAMTNQLAKVTKVPSRILAPGLVAISVFAAFVDGYQLWNIPIVVGVGLFAYYFRKFGYSIVALVMAFVLAPLAETALYRTMLMSDGSVSIFFARPASLAILLGITAVLVLQAVRYVRRTTGRT